MRRLWYDHVSRTRSYVVSALGSLPDEATVAAHLQANQDQIGAAFGEHYGRAAGAHLAKLLHEHIDIAVSLVGAFKARAPAETLVARWYANADEISAYLGSVNPYWQGTAPRDMMREHLGTTTAFLKARLAGDWAGAEPLYDRVVSLALRMADMLTDGIEARR